MKHVHRALLLPGIGNRLLTLVDAACEVASALHPHQHGIMVEQRILNQRPEHHPARQKHTPFQDAGESDHNGDQSDGVGKGVPISPNVGWTLSQASQFPINGVDDTLDNEQEARQNNFFPGDKNRSNEGKHQMEVGHLKNGDRFFLEKTRPCSSERSAPFRQIYDLDVAVFSYAHGHARWKYWPAPHNPAL